MELKQLIHQAAVIAGSDYKLAAELDQPRQRVSDWKAGRKPCPMPDLLYMARMAKVTDHELRELLEAQEVERHAGTPRGEKLARVVGKALAGVVATLCIFGTTVQDARAAGSSQNVELVKRLRRIWEMLNLTLHRNAKLA